MMPIFLALRFSRRGRDLGGHGGGMSRSLPVHVWLILTVFLISAIAVGIEFTLTLNLENSWQQQAANARVISIQQIIGSNPVQWHNASWQRYADSRLAAQHADVAVFMAGRTIPAFTTPGAHHYLATAPSAASSPSAQVPYSPPSSALPVFQRLVIPAPSAGKPPPGIAWVWYTDVPPGEPSIIWWFVVAYGTMGLLVAIVIWLLNRAVLRPLVAMSRAAEAIAGGELDVQLPSSPVQEVAQVSAALEGMSAALRESLTKQATLEEERRLFISAVAHDLRTPLFMLRGYLKGLETGVAATPEKIAHYVEVCLAKADSLERLIADLFAFTRLEYLEQEPERAPLELGALLRETADGMRPLAAERGIELCLCGAAELCPLSGDQHLLDRAVQNLLDNALRHTLEGGTVTLRWCQDGNTVTFSVEDTGPGIAAPDLPYIFTPLYRAEASRNRQTGGAGLGLTIARRILRAHGGDLSAANAPGGGAIFSAVLPAAEHARSLDAAVAGDAPPPAIGTPSSRREL